MNLVSYPIDTDWVIDHLNGVEAVTARLASLRQRGLALSIISVAELWEGVYFSKDPGRSQMMLEMFLSGVAVLGIDEEICRQFGHLRGSWRQEGKMVGDFDLLIAASALRHNLTLLTNNRRHFADIEGLRIESVG